MFLLGRVVSRARARKKSDRWACLRNFFDSTRTTGMGVENQVCDGKGIPVKWRNHGDGSCTTEIRQPSGQFESRLDNMPWFATLRP